MSKKPETFVEILDAVMEGVTEEPWEDEFAFNNGGVPLGSVRVPFENPQTGEMTTRQLHSQDLMREQDARAIVFLRNLVPQLRRVAVMAVHEYYDDALADALDALDAKARELWEGE